MILLFSCSQIASEAFRASGGTATTDSRNWSTEKGAVFMNYQIGDSGQLICGDRIEIGDVAIKAGLTVQWMWILTGQ
jgi:hypothetical protein